LDAHATVESARALGDRAQLVARELDVFDREGLEQRGTAEPTAGVLRDRAAVVFALRDRELEDGGVRGHAHDAFVTHQAVELPREQVIAADEIEPHALSERLELLGTAGHRSLRDKTSATRRILREAHHAAFRVTTDRHAVA